METAAEVAKDCFVILEYRVRLKDGSFVRGSQQEAASLNFIVGYGQVLPTLERRLLGLQVGETSRFAIPATEAFGEQDPSQVKRRRLDDFPEGRRLEVGKWVAATNPATQAQYTYFVKEKTDEEVVLDFNHPLAGEDLFYEVTVTHVRQALPEELEFLRPCEQEKDEEETAKPS